MKQILILVESPAKITKLKHILNEQNDGNNYIIAATVGHILGLNSEKTLGVDVDNKYKPDYIPLPEKKDVIANLQRLKKQCDEVWIASDLDLEGEFIGWSICHLLKLPVTTTKRIIFNEITKTAILKSIKNPKILDFNLLDAQTCRRVADRLIGFLITWAAKSINQKLTVGRVQTIMVKLVIDREKEMENFNKTLSYHTQGIFNHLKIKGDIDAKLNKTFNDQKQIKEFMDTCKDTNKFTIESINDRIVKKTPPAPLITSTLQTLVSRSMGISPKEVLDTAQSLYQQGIISYPRTDCPKLPEEKMDECEKYLLKKYDPIYYERREFKSTDTSAQEAHSCIYPTKVELSELVDSEEITFNMRQKRVYKFIWLYTVSSQMSQSETKITKASINIEGRNEKFIAENSNLIFEGYLKIWGKTAIAEEGDGAENIPEDDVNNSEDEKNKVILSLKVGDELNVNEIQSKQKASQGPSPHTEASLITQLKKHSVGRPATHGQILQMVMDEDKKGFIYKTTKTGEKLKINMFTWKPKAKNEVIEKTIDTVQSSYRNRLYSTELGRAIDDFVNTYFSDIFNYSFTKDLETKMEEIQEGQHQWYNVIDELYKKFAPKLKQFKTWKNKNDDPDNPGRKPKRELGTYENENVYVYLSKFGPVIQIGNDEEPNDSKDKKNPKKDTNKRFISLPKEYNLEKVTLKEIEHLFGFPHDLGKIKDGRNLTLKKSKYGLYLECNKLNDTDKPKTYQVNETMFKELEIDIPWENQINKLDIDLISEAIASHDKPKECLRQIQDIRIMSGKFGPYFIFNEILCGIPKFHNIDLITYDECLHIYQCKINKTRGSKKKPDDATTENNETIKDNKTTKKPEIKFKVKVETKEVQVKTKEPEKKKITMNLKK